MSREPLSVVIITLNEAKRLEACLQSVAFADEVLVVDSGSADGTPALAERLGARVLHQDWLGYGPQKRFGVEQAAHDWVLCIDADERLDGALARGIESALAQPTHKAYRMRRCNRFMGRWLRHGEGYPDWSLRLFHRQYADWSLDPVHEKVVTAEPVGDLPGDLMHESQETLSLYLEKQNRYTSAQAEAMFARGKRAAAVRLVTSPVSRFIKFYLLRLGFLDGVPGLVHIAIGCFNSFSKYAKLAELWRRDEGAKEIE